MELIGHIGVDSGQVMIGDPCYLESWKGHEFTSLQKDGVVAAPTEEYSYDGACTATCSKEGVGILEKGLAAVVQSGYGDGEYPVYVKRDSVGRVIRLVIEFDERNEGDY